MLKNLRQFMGFDWEAFATDKEFTVSGCEAWKEYNSGNHLGTKVTVVITKDDTVYHSKNGDIQSNLGEKIVFKIPKDVTVGLNKKICPVAPKVTAYGRNANGDFTSYLNCLAIECEDITVL